MKREHVDVNEQLGFTQIVSVEKGGLKTLYISGQTGSSSDLKSQSIEAFTSLKGLLETAGAAPSDLVKFTIYVVDYSPDKARDAFAGMATLGIDPKTPPAATLIGVQGLFMPELQIEVEAVAVVDTE
ncbi:MAG: RidA family protein [Pseudomonadales bacterium]|nr:RidA family protein [Pseudomonadales bacterium]